jgi:uncharacterized protein YkwD
MRNFLQKTLSIFTILCGFVLLPALSSATTIGGEEAVHPFESDPQLQYNCQYIESASLYRPCTRRYGDDGFDAIPSTGSFGVRDGAMTNVSDIDGLDNYRFAIEYTVDEGYFNLFRNRHFVPSLNITREEFISILMDVLETEIPANTSTSCFADLRLVDRTKSAEVQEMRKKKICYARSKGWLDQNDRFMPRKHINRAAAAKILMSAYRFPNAYSSLRDNYFDDVREGEWFGRFVNAGRKANIFPDKRRFNPGALLTRKEASLWFYNLARQLRSPVPEDTQILDIKEFTETKLSQMINESRMKYKKPQLKFNEDIYQLALMHSREMSEKSSLTHGNLDNYRQFLGYEYMAIGENIAMYRTTGKDDISEMVERIHTNMMAEPRGQLNHRANILGETFAFTEFAVAAYEDRADSRVWVTQIFAKKRP